MFDLAKRPSKGNSLDSAWSKSKFALRAFVDDVNFLWNSLLRPTFGFRRGA